MSLVPDAKADKIAFFETRLAPWADHAAEIGTSTEAVSNLTDKTNDARAAFIEQQAAQATAQSATLKMKMAIDAMATAGANIIRQIRTQAATTGDDGVYSLASIPPPAEPSPIGAPGQPEQFSFKVDAIGVLFLKWKCKNPQGAVGTMYQVSRRIGSDSGFTYIGGSGTKSFIDDTLPAGTATVIYQIQAVRSTKVGPAATFNVNFGVSRAQARTIAIHQTTQTKRAA
jgi:hypothetical protein